MAEANAQEAHLDPDGESLGATGNMVPPPSEAIIAWLKTFDLEVPPLTQEPKRWVYRRVEGAPWGSIVSLEWPEPVTIAQQVSPEDAEFIVKAHQALHLRQGD